MAQRTTEERTQRTFFLSSAAVPAGTGRHERAPAQVPNPDLTLDLGLPQAKVASLAGDRAAVARELLKQARFACGRIEAGIDARSDPDV